MRKPDFEQFRATLLRKSKPTLQRDRQPFLDAAVAHSESSGEILIQKARKDGHDDAMLELHGTWIGTDFSASHTLAQLQSAWRSSPFADGELKYWIEAEDEIVTLVFALAFSDGRYLTGRIKVTA